MSLARMWTPPMSRSAGLAQQKALYEWRTCLGGSMELAVVLSLSLSISSSSRSSRAMLSLDSYPENLDNQMPYVGAVFRIRIRIRIHKFLGLLDPDPDPLVIDMDPDPALDPEPSIIMQK